MSRTIKLNVADKYWKVNRRISDGVKSMKPKRVKRDALHASYFRLQSTVDNMLDRVTVIAALFVHNRVPPLKQVVDVGRTIIRICIIKK
jgi:hypothetical protein